MEEVYRKLAKVLDTLPNGFPATESGAELKLLKKIFTPEQADLFCDMRLSFETAADVAKRTGRPLEGLEDKLRGMAADGQLFGFNFGGVWVFKMLPWVFGIYEFQNQRMDEEFVKLNEEFSPHFGRQFFSNTPQLMQVIPIEEQIEVKQEALAYEKVSTLIERSQSFWVQDCVCKKEKGLLGHPCDRPMEVCLALAPIPGVFDKMKYGRVLTREEAYALLKKTEELGLVHLTANTQNDNIYICNCCGCCCGVLSGINKLGIPASTVINSHYYAQIEPEKCVSCGVCANERCQVKAIEEVDNIYSIVAERCIGCGLCITTCPGEAIRLVHKDADKRVAPPVNEKVWFEERGRLRGVDYSKFK
jgi:Fe-S-cluster-containing hydrogenase component 2